MAFSGPQSAFALQFRVPNSQVPPIGMSKARAIVPLATVAEVNRPSIFPIPEREATTFPLAAGNVPLASLVKDPAEKPSHFKSVRATFTEVIDAPSSETVRLIVPPLAFPLISMGPVRTAPG